MVPFPTKFRALIETTLDGVEKPDYLWMTYSVCACSADACGWAGWTIEAAFKKSRRPHPTGTGDKLLSAQDHQNCPVCGRDLFRTEASVKYEPSADQTTPAAGTPIVSVPLEYE
jgi:hypothetical protein